MGSVTPSYLPYREVLPLLVLLHVIGDCLELPGLHVLTGDVQPASSLPALTRRHQLEVRTLVQALHICRSQEIQLVFQYFISNSI